VKGPSPDFWRRAYLYATDLPPIAEKRAIALNQREGA
jgi:hypothetical protein